MMINFKAEFEENLCVAANFAHSLTPERLEDDSPHFRIALASKISALVRRKLNLGYLDLENFKREDYENDGDILIVENAGRDLYLVGEFLHS
jgi:hypothetical protein